MFELKVFTIPEDGSDPKLVEVKYVGSVGMALVYFVDNYKSDSYRYEVNPKK